LQLGLSAAQLPFTQDCPQHSALLLHLAPSAIQCCAAHLPPAQDRLQHSVDLVQLAPAGLHTLSVETHAPTVKSQSREQQSAPEWHCCPKALQLDAAVLPAVPIGLPPPTATGVSPPDPARAGGVSELPPALPAVPRAVSPPVALPLTLALPMLLSPVSDVVPPRAAPTAPPTLARGLPPPLPAADEFAFWPESSSFEQANATTKTTRRELQCRSILDLQ
jgi:hypothetical protein